MRRVYFALSGLGIVVANDPQGVALGWHVSRLSGGVICRWIRANLAFDPIRNDGPQGHNMTARGNAPGNTTGRGKQAL